MMSRKRSSQSLVFTAIFVVGLLVALLVEEGYAFALMPMMSAPGRRGGDAGVRKVVKDAQRNLFRTNRNIILFASPSEKDSDSVQNLFDFDGRNFDGEIDEDDLEEIESGQPSEWMVMQQVSNNI